MILNITIILKKYKNQYTNKKKKMHNSCQCYTYDPHLNWLVFCIIFKKKNSQNKYTLFSCLW